MASLSILPRTSTDWTNVRYPTALSKKGRRRNNKGKEKEVKEENDGLGGGGGDHGRGWGEGCWANANPSNPKTPHPSSSPPTTPSSTPPTHPTPHKRPLKPPTPLHIHKPHTLLTPPCSTSPTSLLPPHHKPFTTPRNLRRRRLSVPTSASLSL
ncbi:hypothetical protein K435DRAFT_874831 [Dendrothele bispora CBS 962.96]|uniref:Uncharacterized protein n=1 Tax=Dendrothele bispora (strain CBS 962.96) TaxID=1314807 RepID=A0A4S8KVU0_DENBC|nr:hypothetical protein K435DRAFT_874831 [Dendrothele bispora CBS 962.96]